MNKMLNKSYKLDLKRKGCFLVLKDKKQWNKQVKVKQY